MRSPRPFRIAALLSVALFAGACLNPNSPNRDEEEPPQPGGTCTVSVGSQTLTGVWIYQNREGEEVLVCQASGGDGGQN